MNIDNTQETTMTPSERMASRIMRALAIVGFVSLIICMAWLVVAGVRLLPHSSDQSGASVNYVASIFKSTRAESLTFTLTSNTFTSGQPVTLSWEYEGANIHPVFTFSYTCVDGVTFSIMTGTEQKELACNVPMTTSDKKITVIPTAIRTRFNDVTLVISTESLTNTRAISVINASLDSALPTLKPTQPTPAPDAPSVPTSAPTITPTVSKPVSIPTVVKPADLSVSIADVGVLADVNGRETFFSLNTIPSHKTGVVKFTVTNTGTMRSDTWGLVVYLPVSGEHAYKYVAPIQNPLEGGAQTEFTLEFDELNKDSTGTIRVEIKPGDATDRTANNTDSRKITIK